MNWGCGHIHSGPGDAVGGATGHTGDLLSLQTLDQGWLPVHRGGAVALLSVVIVAPRIDLLHTLNHRLWDVIKYYSSSYKTDFSVLLHNYWTKELYTQEKVKASLQALDLYNLLKWSNIE